MRTRLATLGRRLLLLGVVFIFVLGAVIALLPRPLVSQWLEDETGHIDTKEQLKGLIYLLLPHPVITKDLVPISHTSVPFLGASTFFDQEVEESKLRRSMQLLREAGVHWIRQEFPWDRIEWSGKGQFVGPYGPTWTHYDRIIDLAQEYGLEVVARPDFSPFWSRRDNSVLRAPPDNYADYGDFIATLADRYKGRVKHYQIWNEPNLAFEWGQTPSPSEYTELLKVAYERAKGVDPNVVILSAALSPTLGTPDGKNVSDLDYLQGLYDAGAADYFDILSAQGYGLWTGPGDRRAEAGQVNMSRVQLLRQVMVRNRDEHKAVWVSEFGWDAVPPDFPIEAMHGRVTEEQQARYTQAGLERIRDEWPWVGVVFYWHSRMISDEQRRQEDFYFRMIDPDFTTRPVYDAIQRVALQRSALRYGWQQENDSAISYSDGWENRTRSGLPRGYPPSYKATNKAGSTLVFAFVGSDLTLVTYRGTDASKLAVTVDGKSMPDVNLLAAQQQWEAQVPLAIGLSDGYHTVTITAFDEGEVVIDGFIVTARRGLSLQLLVGLVLLTGVGFTLSLAVAAAVTHRESQSAR